MLRTFFEWMGNTSFSQGILNSVYQSAAYNLVHLLSMVIFAGAILVVDLRLLGKGLTTQPIAQVARAAQPWLIGGFLGLLLMRFAAVLFIKLLEKFPRFETSAYLLVSLIGLKLLVDWLANTPADPHRINFHSPSSPEFWIFWILMVACFSVGFIKPKPKRA